MPAVELVVLSNRLLSALLSKERSRLLASCEEIELTLAEVLVEPDSRICYIYLMYPVNSRALCQTIDRVIL
jgi:hypothetical protein